MIPKSICLLQRRQKILIHGSGMHRRHYLYASDVVDAIDTVLHKGVVGEIYNIGSNDEFTNLELSSRVLHACGLTSSASDPAGIHWIQHVQDRPFNDYRYAVNASKLAKLGWEQRVTFEEGLRQTVDWYRRYGEIWWGDISTALTAHPVVRGKKLVPQAHHERKASFEAKEFPAMDAVKPPLEVIVNSEARHHESHGEKGKIRKLEEVDESAAEHMRAREEVA
jgi:hypothetical protein